MEAQLLKIIVFILIMLPEVQGVGENGTNPDVGIDSDFKPNSTLTTSGESRLDSPATNTATSTDDDDTVLIVIGVLALVLLIIAVIVFCWWFRVKHSRQPQPPAPEWISEINNRCKDLEGDWVELEILSKAVQYQQHVDKKKVDVVNVVPKMKKDRARSRTVCFNNSRMEQILPGPSSSSQDDSALQENFRISDLTNNVASGWSTLPNPKKGRKNSTENAAEPIETTTSVSSKEVTDGDGESKLRFATFRRPSQLTDKIRNSLEVDSTSFRVPLPKMNFTHDLTEDLQVSPMSSSCGSDYKQRHTAVSIEIEKDIGNQNHDDNSNTCRSDIREDFPPELPGPVPVQAITSTCNTHENMDDIELCESFKRTMSAKGIIFSD